MLLGRGHIFNDLAGRVRDLAKTGGGHKMRPLGLKPALIPEALRGAEAPLFHGCRSAAFPRVPKRRFCTVPNHPGSEVPHTFVGFRSPQTRALPEPVYEMTG
jgi:hypothetical protein